MLKESQLIHEGCDSLVLGDGPLMFFKLPVEIDGGVTYHSVKSSSVCPLALWLVLVTNPMVV